MKISQKLVSGFIGIALLIGVAGYISVGISRKALQKAIGEETVVLARETLDKIDRMLYYRIERWMSFAAANTRLRETVLSSNQEFEKLINMQGYIDQKEREWISAPKERITPFMESLLNNKSSQQLKKKIDFYEKRLGYKLISEAFVTNKYGANIAQTGKTTDYKQDDEEWWQKAKEDGLYVGDVEYDESAAVYSIAVCIRIDDENGNFSGVIKVILNIWGVINIIKETELAEIRAAHITSEFSLLTKDGRIIYSTREFEIFDNTPQAVLSRFKKRREEYVNYFIAKSAMSGKEELFSYAYSKGYRSYKGLGWILVAGHETEEIFAPVVKLRNVILVVSLLIITIAVLIGLFISRAISTPITKLKNAAEEIGKGKLDTKIDIRSSDEIGDLAGAFKKMAQDLKKSHDKLESYSSDLEKTVEKRTRELEEAKSGLEKTVDERTKELQERYSELNRSQTAMLYMVEDLNKQAKEIRDTRDALIRSEKLAAIGQLASSVAHELRNPLGAMKNALYYFNMVELGKGDADIKENLDIISEEIQNSDKIIGDLLEFSRIKKPILQPEKINTIIKETLDRLRIKPNIDVVTELEDAVPDIEIDGPQIRQVFYNLILNAVQAMDKGGDLVVSTRVREAGSKEQGGFIEVSIADTGPGIPDKNLEKIFEPLFSTKTKGTGLGLSVCASLVEGHGGRIEVESERGKGTVFRVTLPIKRG